MVANMDAQVANNHDVVSVSTDSDGVTFTVNVADVSGSVHYFPDGDYVPGAIQSVPVASGLPAMVQLPPGSYGWHFWYAPKDVKEGEGNYGGGGKFVIHK